MQAHNRKPGSRERNGRLSRKPIEAHTRFMADLSQEDRDTLSGPLEARRRVFDVDPQYLRDQKAGSAIGRYCLQGMISEPQYDAAMLFIKSHEQHLRGIDPPQQPRAVDLNRTQGVSNFEEDPELINKLRLNHKAALKSIQAKQNELRLNGNLYAALYAVLMREVMHDSLLGDLRIALNALVHHYGLQRVAA